MICKIQILTPTYTRVIHFYLKFKFLKVFFDIGKNNNSIYMAHKVHRNRIRP